MRLRPRPSRLLGSIASAASETVDEFRALPAPSFIMKCILAEKSPSDPVYAGLMYVLWNKYWLPCSSAWPKAEWLQQMMAAIPHRMEIECFMSFRLVRDGYETLIDFFFAGRCFHLQDVTV